MPKSKTVEDAPSKAEPAPSVDIKPEEPEKQSGPGHIMRANQTPATPEMGAPERARYMRMMQQSVGNTRVNRMLGGTPAHRVQAKLSVSAPDDLQEREADQVADMAVDKPAPEDMQQSARLSARTSSAGPEVMPITATPSPAEAISPEAEADIEDMRGGGQPLPETTRAEMESKFGQDMGNVRIHTDDRAAKTARNINARAFTTGRDIAFAPGQYAPDTPEGKRLLAHELTHTIQQGAAGMLHRVMSVQRKTRTRTKTSTELKADFVKAQVDLGRFSDLPVSLPEGESGPPSPGGAFWILNGLNPEEMHEVLRLCGKDVRTKLLIHIADTEGRFDRPRLESALRSTAWGEKKAGIAGLEITDAIRNAGAGSFVDVWALLAGKSRVQVISALRTLPRTMLTQLQTRLSEAPASDVTKFTEVIADLLGTETNMQANDVIDLQGLSGLDRVMASIYNLRGQLIEERARALGVPTHAAAGIMKVESGGATFNEATDKTIVRFENHVFWNEWGQHHVADFNAHFDFDRVRGGKPFAQHRFRDSPTGTWEACHQSQVQEWRIMEFAAGLSGKEPAYRSASWGAGQIMGFNAHMVGYGSAVDMAAAFNRAERPQVTGIFEFIRDAGLAPAVIRGDYLAVARGYNGPGQAPTYASLIQDAAMAYQRVTAGKTHVIP